MVCDIQPRLYKHAHNTYKHEERGQNKLLNFPLPLLISSLSIIIEYYPPQV